ncbi:outer membrane receptor protein involved in Fe transport [Wenyingzhuangia heitensis]|uniref:Outer membrane receptor protein involved in Fe transport n=1 Tax=Wenyingzhuangia heitensis TaxID=1487859 RepID=A0ABX0U7R6_9FLAO|nr:TonB-dependent receptor plug domain-containing protein [Wenyingzhuangia heitensis]NIJ43795.1 outer membrane receptor protein involved in Fe transport [Wenyingzhuangia heitensis]
MKKIILLTLLLTSIAYNGFGQNTISGLVKDTFGQPIPVTSIKLLNANDKGTFTNFNGEFELKTPAVTGEIEISSLGYLTKIIAFNTSTNNLNITLESSTVGLDEVVVFASRAIDRKTPVAYSTVKQEEIEQKLGNQEFVEILKSTPGVYTTRAGGGFGDGEITMRGFNSENVAVVINGVPVNAAKDGRVFWSNWSGIGNVTASTQTQRGLGASKLAVPSIGGTINIITQSTEAKQGGRFEYGIGNDGYQKYGLKLSTGLLDNGFAVTAYADKITGQGYVDGTSFEAMSYFTSISKKLNDQHKLSFFVTGAPQNHGQRFDMLTIQQFRESDRGRKTNKNWGYRNGQEYSLSSNFFHKPIASLNHYWKIDESSKLSTSIYYSKGDGGVNFEEGPDSGDLDKAEYRFGDEYSPVNLDQVVSQNKTNAESTIYIQSRTNDHTWAGGLTSYNLEINKELDFTAGADFRYTKVSSGKEMLDLLGGEYIIDLDGNVNNPNNVVTVGEKYDFYSTAFNTTYGGFAQVEYDYDQITAFVAANISNTVYAREDHFAKLDGDPNQKTDDINFVGYGAKGGINYRIDGYHNVFFNTGYFERAPFFSSVWPTNDNDQTNTNAENQKIFSLELGYGLRTDKFAANVNIYRTAWNDRTETRSRSLPDNGGVVFANILGVNALHQGVEFDFEYRPLETLTLKGALSLGDWTWQDDVTAILTDESNNVIDEINILISDLPVGRSAQTSLALGAEYKITKNTSIFADFNYYDRFYADFDPSNRNSEGVDPWKVPSYSLVDLSLQHKFKIGVLDAKLMARMYNAFDTEYITRADDIDGTAANARVYYGVGRTFSVSSVINF